MRFCVWICENSIYVLSLRFETETVWDIRKVLLMFDTAGTVRLTTRFLEVFRYLNSGNIQTKREIAVTRPKRTYVWHLHLTRGVRFHFQVNIVVIESARFSPLTFVTCVISRDESQRFLLQRDATIAARLSIVRICIGIRLCELIISRVSLICSRRIIHSAKRKVGGRRKFSVM